MNLMTEPEKFCQVNFYHIKPNKKYIITDMVGIFHYVGIFSHYQKGHYQKMGKDIAIFKNVICTSPYDRPCGYVSFSYSVERKFYTLISKKIQIQDAMEARALIKILKKITGDDLFTWQ